MTLTVIGIVMGLLSGLMWVTLVIFSALLISDWRKRK